MVRAAFKVLQMLVQAFVTAAQLTIVGPSDPLAQDHLNNSTTLIAAHHCRGPWCIVLTAPILKAVLTVVDLGKLIQLIGSQAYQ